MADKLWFEVRLLPQSLDSLVVTITSKASSRGSLAPEKTGKDLEIHDKPPQQARIIALCSSASKRYRPKWSQWILIWISGVCRLVWEGKKGFSTKRLQKIYVLSFHLYSVACGSFMCHLDPLKILQAVKECREAVSLMLEMQRTDDTGASKRGNKNRGEMGGFFWTWIFLLEIWKKLMKSDAHNAFSVIWCVYIYIYKCIYINVYIYIYIYIQDDLSMHDSSAMVWHTTLWNIWFIHEATSRTTRFVAVLLEAGLARLSSWLNCCVSLQLSRYWDERPSSF